MKKYKILFIGLDNVLINTLSGKPVPDGIWDMKLNMSVLDAIKNMSPEYVTIVSNQNLSKETLRSWAFSSKILYIEDCISEYCKIPNDFLGENRIFGYCFPVDAEQAKPSTYMLESGLDHFGLLPADKSDMLLVGNDDVDKKTARNFKIDYMSVDEFINNYKDNI